MRGVRGDDSKCCFGMQIFGIHLAASVGVTEAEFLHVGSVLAGYLDNDSDSSVPGHLNSRASLTPTASVPELGPRLATFALGRGLPVTNSASGLGSPLKQLGPPLPHLHWGVAQPCMRPIP